MARPESNAPSFDETVRAHLDYVWRVARVMVDDQSADDITQEVFLVARRRLAEVDVASVRGWLYGITRNVARNHRRSLGRRLRALARLPPPEPVPPPDALYDRREAAALMDDFLGSLSEPKREAFMLHVLEGLTAAEIADAIDVPTRTVYSRVRAAKAELDRFRQRTHGRTQP